MQTNEYCVYVYHKQRQNDPRLPQWERVGATRNEKRAIKHAKLLSRKKQYERIEIQKKSYNTEQNKRTGYVFRIYESGFNHWEKLFHAVQDQMKRR
ncbi:MAG: hypothetical protein ACRBDL_10740 [Alphaproteobacteria bacterium]